MGFRHSPVRVARDRIDLYAVDCGEFLRQDSPDAWVLAILCDFGQRLPRDVVHLILTRLQQWFGDNPPRLREYVEMLDVLADNRDLSLDIYEEMNMLNINVEKLATYRMGMEKGREEGEHHQALEIAKRMLNAGYEPAHAAALTGLSVGEVEILAGEKPKLDG
ncbi:hypothetical protein [Methylomagnum sp.]